MASIAGNKRHHCEHTLDVKHIALMEIEWGVTNKDVSKKFNVPKKHTIYVEKEQTKLWLHLKAVVELKDSAWRKGHMSKSI